MEFVLKREKVGGGSLHVIVQVIVGALGFSFVVRVLEGFRFAKAAIVLGPFGVANEFRGTVLSNAVEFVERAGFEIVHKSGGVSSWSCRRLHRVLWNELRRMDFSFQWVGLVAAKN